MLLYIQILATEEDRAAFERLYLTYRQLMFRVAMGILREEADAEDAVHQAFLAILEQIERLPQAGQPEARALCVLIAERKAIDILRARKHLTGEDPERALEGVEIPQPGDGGLADAMTRLPVRYRQALLLRYFLGYSSREMGKLLGMRQSAVQKLLYRAKTALKHQMEREGAEP